MDEWLGVFIAGYIAGIATVATFHAWLVIKGTHLIEDADSIIMNIGVDEHDLAGEKFMLNNDTEVKIGQAVN